MTTPTNFNTWLSETYDIKHWVLARRTAKRLEKYGEETTFFTQKQYNALVEEHRVAVREDLLYVLGGEFGFYRYDILRAAFELGRKHP